ncbi:GatB/YqeY domain-containing protein [Erythrobacter sp. NFXS35]|uniref:GatB/YqeY domain-containing protein n=1 Tax=Erythrobacter sp. NFXS35 TaxID=2818436 RepID=UPI0032DFB9B9
MIRDDIKAATITAMKAGEKDRTAALRQISAKIKDRDIEERTSAKDIPDDELVVSVLQKMAKQRRESIEMYEAGGREELAAKERAELEVIEEFLPRMMDEAETKAAIAAIKAETGASSMKDMGTVMGELKARHGAVLDGKLASTLVKAGLS